MKHHAFATLFKYYLPLVLVAIGVGAAGIYYHQAPLRILPLFISMAVSILQSRVSRYACLIGSFNSLLYALADWHYGLYASCAGDILLSFPFQLATFINWSRHSYKQSTMLKRMNTKQRFCVAIGFLTLWSIIYYSLKLCGSEYQVMDTTMTMFGLLILVLTLLAYVEYTWLMIPNCLTSVLLNIQVFMNQPDRMSFLIFSFYSLYCNTLGFFQAKKLLKEQQNLKANTP